MLEHEPRIRDYDLGGGGLEAYYVEVRGEPHMAVQPGLDAERRRLWEAVAHGVRRVPLFTRRLVGTTAPETDGFYFFGAGRSREADPLAVLAARAVLEEMETGWCEAIRDAERLADRNEVIAAWCGLPMEAVLATRGDWRTRL